MFIDSAAKVNYGSSGAEWLRPEGGAPAINIWSLRNRSYIEATHYYGKLLKN